MFTFTTLWANSADDKLLIIFLFFQENIRHFMQTVYIWYFPQKTGFDLSCKLSSLEKICMKSQVLFSGKNKKSISMLPADNFTQRAKC